ncbi:MAG: peptidylprolyl isomerase [Bacilli bacterium]|nr:peptidylprolyl isomerase [Bacilli bacterium]
MKKKEKLLISLFAVLLFVTSCGKAPKLENGQEAVVTLKKGDNISIDSLYEEMKDTYALSVLLDMIDTQILAEEYPESDDEKAYIDSQLAQFEYYYDAYYSTQYKSFEEFLYAMYGVDTTDELKEILSLSFKREEATKDYAKTTIKDDEIEEYYDEEIIGDMKASHILITADYEDDATEDEIEKAKADAKKKAEDLIKELNKADKDEVEELFAKLAKEHSEDGSAEDGGDLDWFSGGDMVESFEKATIELKVGKYTKEPVESEYGYHIILKTGQKDKAELKEVKDEIIDALVEKKLEEDSTLQAKALIALRDEYGIEIQDTELKKQYKTYIENSKKAQ